ncbi:hypothetical protein, partial [Meiothermus hypogaeus]|uniref:hypothetical protein n=1 Tax=Meiothermus hypogaeus TaxID=884155 RepID=UPI001C99C4F6
NLVLEFPVPDRTVAARMGSNVNVCEGRDRVFHEYEPSGAAKDLNHALFPMAECFVVSGKNLLEPAQPAGLGGLS